MNSILLDTKQNFIDTGAFNKENFALELIEKEIHNTLANCKGVMSEMCNHIATSGGKRVRPLLVLYSGLIFSNASNKLIRAAVASELIHMASLVHDDIIDHSELRRNKPSVNKVWGTHYGVLCGDYLYAKAFNILSASKLVKSLDFLVEAIENMCDGEILQAENRFNRDMTLELYYEQIFKKTACLLACCCSSGADLGGASEAQIKIMYDYGLNIGLAFQIIDDILDFCGDKKIMGKPQGEDLRQGIITLPVILLLNTKDTGYVYEILSKDKYEDQDIKTVNRLLHNYGTIEESYRIAHVHIEKAKKLLEQLPKSQYKQYLNTLAEKLKTRRY